MGLAATTFITSVTLEENTWFCGDEDAPVKLVLIKRTMTIPYGWMS